MYGRDATGKSVTRPARSRRGEMWRRMRARTSPLYENPYNIFVYADVTYAVRVHKCIAKSVRAEHVFSALMRYPRRE